MKSNTTLTALTLAAVTAAALSTGVSAQTATQTGDQDQAATPVPPKSADMKPGDKMHGDKGMHHGKMRPGHPGMRPPMGMGFGMGPGLPPFAVLDANKDGKVTPDEIKAYEAKMVEGLDANKDGMLTADEIAAQFTKVDRMRMEAGFAAMAKRVNPQGDGKLTIDQLAARPYPAERILDRMLKKGDGKITQADFDKMKERFAQRAEKMAERAQKHAMHEGGKPGHDGAKDHAKAHDRGHDKAHMDCHHGNPMRAMRAAMAAHAFDKIDFAQIDANKDGVITGDEIKAWHLAQVKAMYPGNDGTVTAQQFADARLAKMKPAIEKRADGIVKRFDLNGDGKLDISELAAAPMTMMFAHLPIKADGAMTQAQYQKALRHMMPGHGHHGDWQHGPKHHWKQGKDHGPMKTQDKKMPATDGTDGAAAPDASGN